MSKQKLRKENQLLESQLVAVREMKRAEKEGKRAQLSIGDGRTPKDAFMGQTLWLPRPRASVVQNQLLVQPPCGCPSPHAMTRSYDRPCLQLSLRDLLLLVMQGT